MKRFVLILTVLVMAFSMVMIPDSGKAAMEVMTDAQMEEISAQGFPYLLNWLYPDPNAAIVIGPITVPLDPIINLIDDCEILECAVDALGSLLRWISR